MHFIPGVHTYEFWNTPDELYAYLNEQHHFDFDPCPANPTFNGLMVGWGECNFVNPPFNDITSWLHKGLQEQQQHNRKSVFLLPVRTSVKYFHEIILKYASKIQFLTHRVSFISQIDGKHSSAPFDCMVVILEAPPTRTTQTSTDQPREQWLPLLEPASQIADQLEPMLECD